MKQEKAWLNDYKREYIKGEVFKEESSEGGQDSDESAYNP